MQAYYNYDVNYNFGEKAHASFFAPVVNWREEGYYISTNSHIINLDFIFNAYTSKTLDFGFILGAGAGVESPLFGKRYNNDHAPRAIAQRSFLVARANLGMRLLFDKKYGFEFFSKIPLNPFIYQYMSSPPHNGNLRRGLSSITKAIIDLPLIS